MPFNATSAETSADGTQIIVHTEAHTYIEVNSLSGVYFDTPGGAAVDYAETSGTDIIFHIDTPIEAGDTGINAGYSSAAVDPDDRSTGIFDGLGNYLGDYVLPVTNNVVGETTVDINLTDIDYFGGADFGGAEWYFSGATAYGEFEIQLTGATSLALLGRGSGGGTVLKIQAVESPAQPNRTDDSSVSISGSVVYHDILTGLDSSKTYNIRGKFADGHLVTVAGFLRATGPAPVFSRNPEVAHSYSVTDSAFTSKVRLQGLAANWVVNTTDYSIPVLINGYPSNAINISGANFTTVRALIQKAVDVQIWFIIDGVAHYITQSGTTSTNQWFGGAVDGITVAAGNHTLRILAITRVASNSTPTIVPYIRVAFGGGTGLPGSAPAAQTRLTFAGDSIMEAPALNEGQTVSQLTGGYPQYLVEAEAYEVTNLAIAGTFASSAATNTFMGHADYGFEHDSHIAHIVAQASDTGIIVVGYGRNDAFLSGTTGESSSDFQASTTAGLTKLTDPSTGRPNAPIRVLNILPNGDSGTPTPSYFTTYNTAIAAAVSAVNTLRGNSNITVIDISAGFDWTAGVHTLDGLHPNRAGRLVLGANLITQLAGGGGGGGGGGQGIIGGVGTFIGG